MRLRRKSGGRESGENGVVERESLLKGFRIHNKIGIMHLAAGLWKNNKDMRTNKDVKVTIQTVQGPELQKSLRYGKV